jgi:signal peptidase I
LTLFAVTFLVTGKDVLAMRSYNIPAESMAPTVMVGDLLLADPRAYENHKPERGDVVIFKLPSNPKVDYIKRIVGLPGDKVQFKDGQLFLNEIPVLQKILENKLTDQRLKKAKTLLEILPSGRSYQTLSLREDKVPGADNTKMFLVPAGHYFVSGDNRDNSNDSRFPIDVGFVPQKNIYAKAKIIFWAKDLSRIGTMLNP